MAELTLDQLLGSSEGLPGAAGMLQAASPQERRGVFGQFFKKAMPFMAPPGVMEAMEGQDMTMRDLMLLGVLGPLGGKGRKGLKLIQGGKKEGRTFGDEILRQQGRKTFDEVGSVGPREEFEGVIDLVIKNPDLQTVVEPSGLTYVFKKGKNPDDVFKRPLSEAIGTIDPNGRPDDDLRKILTKVLKGDPEFRAGVGRGINSDVSLLKQLKKEHGLGGAPFTHSGKGPLYLRQGPADLTTEIGIIDSAGKRIGRLAVSGSEYVLQISTGKIRPRGGPVYRTLGKFSNPRGAAVHLSGLFDKLR
jgi:hypothetical protein